MDLKEVKQRFGISNELIKKIEKCWKEAEKAEVLFCKAHGLEHFDSESCPGCEKEKAEFAQELQDRSAAALE